MFTLQENSKKIKAKVEAKVMLAKVKYKRWEGVKMKRNQKQQITRIINNKNEH